MKDGDTRDGLAGINITKDGDTHDGPGMKAAIDMDTQAGTTVLNIEKAGRRLEALHKAERELR
jgi:hypothetical protein